MNAWKVATFVFGISLIVLATRQWQRSTAQARAERHEPVESSERAEVTAKVEPPAPTIEKADAVSVTLDDLPHDPGEFILCLLDLHWGAGIHRIEDDLAFELLNARKEEVAPVLERWVRKLPDLADAGANTFQICRAYARVCGVNAIPLLETHVLTSDPEHEGHQAKIALMGIDDVAAAEAAQRIQSSAAPGKWIIHPIHLLNGSRAVRKVLPRWAQHGPPNDPALASEVRQELFFRGTDDEKRLVLPLADAAERDRYVLFVRPKWSREWQEWLHREAPRVMKDSNARYAIGACDLILQRDDLFGEPQAKEALRALELMAAQKDLPEADREEIAKILKRETIEANRRERGRKIRAALLAD